MYEPKYKLKCEQQHLTNANESLFLRSFKTIPLILSGFITFHCDPSGTQFIFLAERVYNFVARAARGSREDRKTTAISLWS